MRPVSDAKEASSGVELDEPNCPPTAKRGVIREWIEAGYPE